MSQQISLQIQAVLYQNDTKELIRALERLVNAVRQDRSRDARIQEACLCWGDASPSPLFEDAEIQALNEKHGDALAINYTFFNENTGYGKGHNLLAANSTTDYLMVANPDILITGDYFKHMLDPFSDPTVGLTEARQTPIEHPKKYDVQTLETPWSSGACFIMQTAFYQQLGGFDTESFFMYSEDVDLSLRIRREGKKLIYVPSAPVYHAKRIDNFVGLTHTKTEIRHSAEAQLVLAYKWNKPSLVHHLIHAFENGNDLQKEAVKSFRRRLDANELKRLSGKTDLFDEGLLVNRFSL